MKKAGKKRPVSNEDLAKSIDNLARMTARGFEQVDKRFEQEDNRFKLIIDRFERLEADTADIKRTLGPIVQMMAMEERRVNNLELRVRRVERRVGLVK